MNISWQAVTAVLLVLAQLVAVVIYVSSEHADQVELKHRFDMFAVEATVRDQRLDDKIDRIDLAGTRALQLVQDRQNGVLSRLNTVDSRLQDQGSRLRELTQRVDKLDGVPTP